MTRRQGGELNVAAVEKCVWSDQERVGLVAAILANATSISRSSRACTISNWTKGSGRRCEIFDAGVGSLGTRIDQRAKTIRRGKKLTQRPHALCHHFAEERVHAGGVAAGAIEAGDEPCLDWITVTP